MTKIINYGPVGPSEKPGLGAVVEHSNNVDVPAELWSGRLQLAMDDPYHFDHSLDHVPGMALVGGLLDLVRDSGAADLERADLRMALSVRFPSFCELSRPVDLRAVRPPSREPGVDTALTLVAQQDDRIVCEAVVTFRAMTSADALPAASGVTRLPADPDSVHRKRLVNVLVTGAAVHGDTRVVGLRSVPAGHALAPTAPDAPHRAELLVDAARQFCTMMCHVEHHRPASTKFVMLGIEADLPCGLRSDVRLRWLVTPPGRGKLSFTAAILAGDLDGEPCGSVSFDYYAAPPAVYRRLRGEALTA